MFEVTYNNSVHQGKGWKVQISATNLGVRLPSTLPQSAEASSFESSIAAISRNSIATVARE